MYIHICIYIYIWGGGASATFQAALGHRGSPVPRGAKRFKWPRNGQAKTGDAKS